MKNPFGHTTIETITAGAVLLFLFFVIVMVKNPLLSLKKQHDLIREEGVKDIMEILLEMEVTNPESFAKVVGPAAAGKSMIGTAESCAGSYGSRCADDVLRNDCLDLQKYASGFLEEVPIDPRDDIFSKEKTGYYISFESGALEIGACYPEARNEITLTKQY